MSNNITEHNDASEITNIDNSSIYTGMNEIFEHTRQIIDDMKQGEKISVADLVCKVASGVKMTQSNVTNLVQMYLKQCKSITVEVGRGGGVYKGGKPKRIDTRPRCPSCNQVVRKEGHNHTSDIGIELF